MPDLPPIDGLFADLDRVIAQGAAAADALQPSKEKEVVSRAVTRLKALRAGADARVKEALGVLQKKCEDDLARLAQLKQKIADGEAAVAKVKADAAAKAAAAAAAVPPVPPVPPLPAIDPALGPALRDDLLRRFGPPADGTPAARPGKDVWENWT